MRNIALIRTKKYTRHCVASIIVYHLMERGEIGQKSNDYLLLPFYLSRGPRNGSFLLFHCRAMLACQRQKIPHLFNVDVITVGFTCGLYRRPPACVLHFFEVSLRYLQSVRECIL